MHYNAVVFCKKCENIYKNGWVYKQEVKLAESANMFSEYEQGTAYDKHL